MHIYVTYIFFLFLHKTICCRYSVAVPLKVLLMSTNNICFCGEIRKIFIVFGVMRRVTCFTHDPLLFIFLEKNMRPF